MILYYYYNFIYCDRINLEFEAINIIIFRYFKKRMSLKSFVLGCVLCAGLSLVGLMLISLVVPFYIIKL